jgi:hypothetical protein
MKHLGLSGTGARIAGIFGVAELLLLEKKYKPDVISAVSGSSFLTLPRPFLLAIVTFG